MRTIRSCGLALAFCLLSALLAQAASAFNAAEMYDPSKVSSIDLELPPASVQELEEHPVDDYVQGFLTIASTAGTPGTEATPTVSHMEVGIRLKGSEGGSFRKLDDGKAAFKIKCNFISGEKCLGLKKMTLNNMVQDPSMVHETLAYAAFRASGVPAPRTGYAYVRVNGDDFGVYLNLETYDDVFLKREFGDFDDDVQHLYEGEYGDDVVAGGAEDFEVDEGGEGPGKIGDLEALIEAVNGADSVPWSERVAPNAELVEMTKMWAVEKYIDHWDGYSGHTEAAQAGERPNNYYLYSEPSGRFQMLPWGTDQTWIPTIGVGTPGREVTFDGKGGVLFNKCLEDKECFRAYWEALSGLQATIAGLDPGSLAESSADLLAPWQAEELAHGRPESVKGEIEDGVEETLDFIAGRQAEAKAWLDENKPPSVVTDPAPPDSQTQSAHYDPGPAALFAGTARSGRYLTARLQLASAGTMTLRASMRAQKGRKNVCASSKAAAGAAEWPISCKLSRAAMDRLAQGPLRLQLVFTVTLASGGTETIVRSVRLPRD